MDFRTIDRSQIADVWEWLGPLISAAAIYDTKYDVEDIKKLLTEGNLTAHAITANDSAGVIVTRISRNKAGAQECSVRYVSGKINGTLKTKRAIMHQVKKHIEEAARDAGCGWVLMSGREKWFKMFDEYEVTHNEPGRFEMKKALNHV